MPAPPFAGQVGNNRSPHSLSPADRSRHCPADRCHRAVRRLQERPLQHPAPLAPHMPPHRRRPRLLPAVLGPRGQPGIRRQLLAAGKTPQVPDFRSPRRGRAEPATPPTTASIPPTARGSSSRRSDSSSPTPSPSRHRSTFRPLHKCGSNPHACNSRAIHAHPKVPSRITGLPLGNCPNCCRQRSPSRCSNRAQNTTWFSSSRAVNRRNVRWTSIPQWDTFVHTLLMAVSLLSLAGHLTVRRETAFHGITTPTNSGHTRAK